MCSIVGVYFVKRDPVPLPEGENVDYSKYLAWGDIHPNVLGTCVVAQMQLVCREANNVIFISILRPFLFLDK